MIITLNANGLNAPTQRYRVTERIQKQDLTHTDKVRRWKKLFHANGNQKEAGVAKLILDGISEVTQSCPTLCDPVDCTLPGTSVHGIFQSRVLDGIDSKIKT